MSLLYDVVYFCKVLVSGSAQLLAFPEDMLGIGVGFVAQRAVCVGTIARVNQAVRRPDAARNNLPEYTFACAAESEFNTFSLGFHGDPHSFLLAAPP